MNTPKLLFIFLFFTNSIVAQERRNRLPEIINTVFDENAPSATADGSTLVYVSAQYIPINPETKEPYESDGLPHNGIYLSKVSESGSFNPPEQILSINSYFNTTKEVFSPFISYDGNTILIAGSGRECFGGLDLYTSTKEVIDGRDVWSTPQNLGEQLNTVGNEIAPCLNPDGKRIYFSREIEKKIGNKQCYKLWYSDKDPKTGKWTKAYALPSPINMGCEHAPRIHPDGKTLYFSSIREEGKHDFDLYQATYVDSSKTWTQPQKLEFINSKNVFYVSPNLCSNFVYYATNGDIYTSTIPERFKLPAMSLIKGSILDSITHKPVKVNITITNPNVSTFKRSIENDLNGNFSMLLGAYEDYTITVKQESLSYKSKTFRLQQASIIPCSTSLLNAYYLTPIPSPSAAPSRSITNYIHFHESRNQRIGLYK